MAIATDKLPVPFKLNLYALESILDANNDFWYGNHGTWFHYHKPIGIKLGYDERMQHIFINVTGDGVRATPIKVSVNDIDLSKAILENLIFAINHS